MGARERGTLHTGKQISTYHTSLGRRQQNTAVSLDNAQHFSKALYATRTCTGRFFVLTKGDRAEISTIKSAGAYS